MKLGPASWYRLSVMLTALCVLSVSVGAQEDATSPSDPRIDPATGRQNVVWPQDRLFDHLHMRLDLDIPDIAKPRLSAVETLTVAPIGEARSVFSLDSHGPEVKTVTVGGSPAGFQAADGKLVIDLPTRVMPGQAVEVVIGYDLDFSKNQGEGLTWSKPIEGAKSETRANVQIHAQGEAELNSKWFVCHDFPNERLTTEIYTTVEDGYEVVSNGHLESKVAQPDGRVKWHWVQDKPHAYYLVTLAIAKFAIVEVGGPETARPGLPMPVYTPWGTEKNISELFGYTPDMVAFYERTFKQPYAWDKYAQVMVRDFSAGGMENTSCTLLTAGSANEGAKGDRDDLISHELAHQWFGDLVTCNSWEHIWLNEGWASYCEALWNEYKGGHLGERASEKRARDLYSRTVLGFLRQQRARNRGSEPGQAAVVSNRYPNPDATFTKTDDPYAKGAVVLHMLRERLGDEAFFAGVAAYLEKYKLKTVQTDDFRRSLEAASGQSLERFFWQWLYRAGIPRVAVEYTWDDATSTLKVEAEQTQTIDYLNPAYAFVLPIYLKFEDGTSRWVEVAMETKSVSGSFKLAAKPSQASVDPNIEVFAAYDTRKPLAMWMNEAADGVTYAARLDAVEHLAWAGEEGAGEVLAKVERDSGELSTLREAARDARRVNGVIASVKHTAQRVLAMVEQATQYAAK
ncbi:MAG: M1 family metallopeptidase [Phycisphaerales bacterium]|jgi:aminopeptidase N